MSRYSHVTDEILSAYLDDAVTASERSLVETAVADDPDVAWRLATMQHTVNLLGRLPDISLPRSFALTEAMIAEPAGAGIPAPVSRQRPMSEPEKVGFWEAWRSFWQGGSILMRNAAAASFAAFLVLAAGGAMISPQNTQQSQQVDFALTIAPDDAMMPQALGDQAERSQFRLGPKEASDLRAMESAQAEPIPQPAAAASEVDEVAMAASDESVASPLVERTLAASAPAEQSDAAAPPPVSADAKVADELTIEKLVVTEPEITAEEANTEANTVSDTGADNASEPITAAAMTMADASVADAESGVAEGDSDPDAAPEAMTATTSANNEANAASDPAQKTAVIENSTAEREVAESAAETTLDRDDLSASSNTDDAVMPAPPTEDEPAVAVELVAEEAHEEAVAMRVEAAPAEANNLAEPPASVQGQGLTTTSASAMSIVQSDPIRFVQMIALALMFFFAALWLLSRRTKSTAH